MGRHKVCNVARCVLISHPYHYNTLGLMDDHDFRFRPKVLASMKKRKAQDLSTAEREQIAQEFMFKINQAAEDDEEAVQNRKPALNKIRMIKV